MVDGARSDLNDLSSLHHDWTVLVPTLRVHSWYQGEGEERKQLTLQMMTVSPSSMNRLYCRKLLIFTTKTTTRVALTIGANLRMRLWNE